MRESTSFHDLRGLSLIGDLYILMGLGLVIGGMFFLWTLNIFGLIFLGLGIFLAAIGYYLDELKPWAWWGAFLGNLGSGGAVSLTIAGAPLQVAITVSYILLHAALTIGILIYLLRPSVRNLFFNSENM